MPLSVGTAPLRWLPPPTVLIQASLVQPETLQPKPKPKPKPKAEVEPVSPPNPPVTEAKLEPAPADESPPPRTYSRCRAAGNVDA